MGNVIQLEFLRMAFRWNYLNWNGQSITMQAEKWLIVIFYGSLLKLGANFG